jgi:hypothetical protein
MPNKHYRIFSFKVSAGESYETSNTAGQLNRSYYISCIAVIHDSQVIKQMTSNGPLPHMKVHRCPPQDREYHDWTRSEEQNGGDPKV